MDVEYKEDKFFTEIAEFLAISTGKEEEDVDDVECFIGRDICCNDWIIDWREEGH